MLNTHSFYNSTLGGTTDNWWVANPWIGNLVGSPASAFWANCGRTNYVCVSGGGGISDGTHPNSIFARYEGVYGNRSQLTLGQLTVQDGTSNTLFFGETLGGQGAGIRDRVLLWWGMHCLSTGAGLGQGNALNEDNMPNGWDGNNRQPRGGASWRFSARHAAGVQFAMGDGAVRTVRFGDTLPPAANLTTATPINIDHMILLQISGRRDGLNADTSSILD